ncbi:flavin prenyltransferase [Methylomarinovum tepidoasis]|uniref:Flavin prenyltransferase UbiX n=1 Tax=Methylomarinovum tepidoasis TaxID=2840183 RepID=A0AAU9CYA3_9GAMM|nr:UbiX family flavin prenyltransferase [Methylomarinovum sp. IN45]BCX89024.1 flavin prenyltransferase [Methylomarinovum sp. IN45]
MKKRLVVALTGATGAVYGVRILELLRPLPAWETHLIVSRAGVMNLHHELGMKKPQVQALADVHYDIDDIAAAIASGAFRVAGMVVAPCSMKTLAAIAHGFGDNLISRAADVTLKERRPLVLVPRETPLNLAHLRNMTAVTEMGGIVFPPLPAFYGRDKTLAEMIDESVGRILGFFGIEIDGLVESWEGL